MKQDLHTSAAVYVIAFMAVHTSVRYLWTTVLLRKSCHLKLTRAQSFSVSVWYATAAPPAISARFKNGQQRLAFISLISFCNLFKPHFRKILSSLMLLPFYGECAAVKNVLKNRKDDNDFKTYGITPTPWLWTFDLLRIHNPLRNEGLWKT